MGILILREAAWKLTEVAASNFSMQEKLWVWLPGQKKMIVCLWEVTGEGNASQKRDNIKAQFNSHFLLPGNLAAFFYVCVWSNMFLRLCNHPCMSSAISSISLSRYFLYPVSFTTSVCTGETKSFISSENGVCFKSQPLVSVYMSFLLKHTSCHCLPVISSQCNALSKRFCRVSWWYKMESCSNCFGEW